MINKSIWRVPITVDLIGPYQPYLRRVMGQLLAGRARGQSGRGLQNFDQVQLQHQIRDTRASKVRLDTIQSRRLSLTKPFIMSAPRYAYIISKSVVSCRGCIKRRSD